MLVCRECNNRKGCTSNEGEVRAIICAGKDGLKHVVIADWREDPGDDLYCDPVGEPYKGFEQYMQTPMSDPVRPHTAEEIRKIKEDHDRALIDTL
jgi:hypothetical protein